MPPTPRGSLRCLRKKYSSHQVLKRGYSRRRRAPARRLQVRWKCTRVFLEAVVGREVHAAAEPPPRSRPRRRARRSMRTFMCTVGTYGLRGCNTSDTPMASKARPASSGRCAWPTAAGGCPSRARSCSRRAPAPPFFDQARVSRRLPLAGARPRRRCGRLAVESASRARRCAPAGRAGRRERRRCPSRASSGRQAARSSWPGQRLMARRGRCRCGTACRRTGCRARLVGALLRQLGRVAQRGDAQHAAAAGAHLPCRPGGAGMEHHGVVGRRPAGR
jgi:hypothetical protein